MKPTCPGPEGNNSTGFKEPSLASNPLNELGGVVPPRPQWHLAMIEVPANVLITALERL